MLRILVCAFMAFSACTSSGVKDLEDDGFQAKGSSRDGRVGVNNDKKVLIKTEVSAADELRIQQKVNEHLEEQMEGEFHTLKRCRRDISDPRLGGSGKVTPIDEVDSLRPVTDVREEMGLDGDGELKIVKEQDFEAKLKAERTYETTLKKMLKLASLHREECEVKMAQARVAAGLPANRYGGGGYFMSDGTWVQTNETEHDLNDAFHIRAKMKARQGVSE